MRPVISRRRHLTYSNVVSTLCLFLVLGGGAALAATHLPKNSVGTRQLRRGSVTTAKVKNRAITGAKVKLSSLGEVPRAEHAATADSAADASALGGSAPSAFARASDLLSAVVVNDGAKATLVRGTPGAGVKRTSAGAVAVTFPRDVSDCTWVAATGNPGNAFIADGLAGTRGTASPDAVLVVTQNVGGPTTTSVQTDMNFHLIVLC